MALQKGAQNWGPGGEPQVSGGPGVGGGTDASPPSAEARSLGLLECTCLSLSKLPAVALVCGPELPH